MGIGSSSNRRRQQDYSYMRPPIQPTPWVPVSSGYGNPYEAYDAVPSLYPTVNGPYGPYPYQHGPPTYYQQHGFYAPPPGTVHMSYPGPSPAGSGYGIASIPPAPIALVPECQKASTVRNHVNLNKSTLRLEKDEANPGYHLVAFSFDAEVAGSISVFFLVKDGENGSLISLDSNVVKPKKVYFKKGTGQKFCQEPGTGVIISILNERECIQASQEDVYSLVIRIETQPQDVRNNLPTENLEVVGGPFDKLVNYQQTYAVVEKKGMDYHVRVVRQTVSVDGKQYEVKEIYGIAPDEEKNSEIGKECVICLSEPKDTTVLPCRHMCMCSQCANVLRLQMNRCPICRCVVENLLTIEVNERFSDTDAAL